jgi:hypothetical protein
MGSAPGTVEVEEGATVAQVLEKADLRLREGATIYRVDDQSTVNPEANVQAGQTLIVVGDVRGG